MKQIFRASLIFVYIAHLSANAQDNATNKNSRLVEQSLIGAVHTKGAKGWTLQERMAHYKVNGLSIAVIHNYKIEWAKGYGLANAVSKAPITIKTRFQAGSISKSINAVGILSLVQKSNVDLNTDINQYLKSWKFPYDSLSKGRHITLVNLLSHTAGLNVPGFTGYNKTQPIPSTLQILQGKFPANSPAIHSIIQPGLRYEYSGGGTMISQLIIEDITHEPYDKFMRNQVLIPLGMLNTSFNAPQKVNSNTLFATGYYKYGNEVKGKYHIYPEKAAAGLWSTPSDLAKYIIAIQEAYRGRANQILTPAMATQMLKPYLNHRAALGVFINDYDGQKYFEHDGLTHGYYSQYYGSLTNGNGVVIMTNSVNTDIAFEIVNSVAKVYGFKGLYRSTEDKAIKIDDAVLQTYVGAYTLAPGAILTITKNRNQLYVQLTGQDKISLFPETENKFYMKVVDAQLEFVKDTKGNIAKAVLYQNGSMNEATKLN